VALGLRAMNSTELAVNTEVKKYIELTKLTGFEKIIRLNFPEVSASESALLEHSLSIQKFCFLMNHFPPLMPKLPPNFTMTLIDIWRKPKNYCYGFALIEEAVSLADRVILMKEGTMAKIYPISFSYPRLEQAIDFTHKVLEIRRDFFA
jgi:ABC-type Fe3+/spermidine/putrescine transport system ATPase subunit